MSDGNGKPLNERRSESDVDSDDAVAASRAVGGDDAAATGGADEAPDAHSTTGTSPNEEFVGRAGGSDDGYAEETGAEARAKVADY